MSDRDRSSSDERAPGRTRRSGAGAASEPANAGVDVDETRADDAPAATSTTSPGASDQDSEQPNDPKPEQQLWDMKKQRALAEASKAIEPAAEAIWSSEPDKKKARDTIEEAYRRAAHAGSDRESAGELRRRYEEVNNKFNNAAADMLRSREGLLLRDKEKDQASHLDRWIANHLAPDKGKVWKNLLERKQVRTRLRNRLGDREKKRLDAAERTKAWEKAFGRWSAPDKEIAALIASYADRIDQLNADINTGNNRDQAIFSFWFEVAPLHLLLRDETVSKDNTPGVDLLRGALGDFPDVQASFDSGKDRSDGSLYLIDPKRLTKKREDVLEGWKKAADEQATAEANYTTRPDAAADLQPRHDKLRDDGWVKGTKDALAAPKP